MYNPLQGLRRIIDGSTLNDSRHGVPPPLYKGCGESFKQIDASMIHRKRCTTLYKGYGESLKGVDPSMIHRGGGVPLYKGCAQSFKVVDSSSFAGGIPPFTKTTLNH